MLRRGMASLGGQVRMCRRYSGGRSALLLLLLLLELAEVGLSRKVGETGEVEAEGVGMALKERSNVGVAFMSPPCGRGSKAKLERWWT